MRKLLLVALVCAEVVPVAQGQTGRIAHFSHAGSTKVVGGAFDNMGLPSPRFAADSVRYVSPRKLLAYGRWLYTNNTDSILSVELPRKMSAARAARYLKQDLELLHFWPDGRGTKLIGFDSLRQSVSPPQRPSSRSVKPTNRTQTFSKRPFQYSYWRELTVVAALGTVGWLLGKKRPA